MQSVSCGTKPTAAQRLNPKLRDQVIVPSSSGGRALFRQASALLPSVQMMNSPVYCALALCPRKPMAHTANAFVSQRHVSLRMKYLPVKFKRRRWIALALGTPRRCGRCSPNKTAGGNQLCYAPPPVTKEGKRMTRRKSFSARGAALFAALVGLGAADQKAAAPPPPTSSYAIPIGPTI